MNGQTERDILQGERVADFRFSGRAALQSRSNLQPDGSNDITTFAILVFEESQSCAANRIVLDCDHFRFYAELVPLEINEADLLLVALATTATGHAPVAIASTRFFPGINQFPFRPGFCDLVVGRDGDVSRGRR